jgi:hypothetical protein
MSVLRFDDPPARPLFRASSSAGPRVAGKRKLHSDTLSLARSRLVGVPALAGPSFSTYAQRKTSIQQTNEPCCSPGLSRIPLN